MNVSKQFVRRVKNHSPIFLNAGLSVLPSDVMTVVKNIHGNIKSQKIKNNP